MTRLLVKPAHDYPRNAVAIGWFRPWDFSLASRRKDLRRRQACLRREARRDPKAGRMNRLGGLVRRSEGLEVYGDRFRFTGGRKWLTGSHIPFCVGACIW